MQFLWFEENAPDKDYADLTDAEISDLVSFVCEAHGYHNGGFRRNNRLKRYPWKFTATGMELAGFVCEYLTKEELVSFVLWVYAKRIYHLDDVQEHNPDELSLDEFITNFTGKPVEEMNVIVEKAIYL